MNCRQRPPMPPGDFSNSRERPLLLIENKDLRGTNPPISEPAEQMRRRVAAENASGSEKIIYEIQSIISFRVS